MKILKIFVFFKKKNNLENNDLSEITNRYNFKNIFIVIFYKNKNNLKILSKISFSNLDFALILIKILLTMMIIRN